MSLSPLTAQISALLASPLHAALPLPLPRLARVPHPVARLPPRLPALHPHRPLAVHRPPLPTGAAAHRRRCSRRPVEGRHHSLDSGHDGCVGGCARRAGLLGDGERAADGWSRGKDGVCPLPGRDPDPQSSAHTARIDQ